MSVDTQSKKLVDLRVVDLRQELEKRGLDKNGVKAVLTERLQKALEDEGKDPLGYVFETSDSVAKKATPVAKKTGQKDRSNNKEKDGEEEEEFLDDSLLEDDGLEMGNQDNKDDENDMKVLEESDEVNGSVEKVKEAVVNDVEMVDLDASEPLKDDEKMKTEEDATKENIDTVKEVFETKEEMPEASVDSSVAMETSAEPKSEEKMEATSVLEKAEPASDSVVKEGPTEVVTPSDEAETSKGLNVVSAENGKAENDSKSTETPSALNDFTVDDMIRLDTSMAKQAEDHESLDVHVDDTQNDLDSDILGKGMDSSESKAVEVAATSTTGESTTSSEKAPETTEPEKADGASAASIQEAPSTTTTSSDKPATAPATETDDKEKSSTPAAKSTPENKDEKNEEKKEDKGKSSSSTGRNLWVSGLSSSTRATDLKTIFSKYGKVVGAKVVTNARSPGSRCYGFVTMSSADEATKCIQHLHRTELHGKMISVERAKNEPGAQSKSSTTSNRKTDAPKSGPPRRDDRGRRDSDKKPDDRKSHDRRDDKKDTRKDDKAPHKDDRRDSHKKDDHKRDEHRKDEKKDDSKKDEKTSSSSSPSKRTTPKKDDKSRTVVMDKSKGEPVVSVDKKEGEENKEEAATAPDSREARAKSTTSTSRSEKGKDDKDVLSFEKIKEERDRERMRQRERRLREEERLRRREIDLEKKRQRDVHMKQRAEAIRLAREREKLRRERQQLEKEKLAAQRLEKLRQEQLERERLEREREEKRKLEQLRLEAEHLRRMAMKRPYESRTRDEYWSEPKRAALSDNRFTTSQTFSSDRFNTFDDSRDTRYGDRGTNSDSFERKVERYDRRDSRNLDSREDRTTRTLDRGRSDRDGRDDRRNEDRFDRFEHERERDRPVVRDDRRDNVGFSRDRDRIREPERRDERRGRSPVRDSRAEWKSERDLRPTQTDTRVVVRASSGGGRDGWQGGGASGSEDRTHSSRAPNTGLGLLGNAPSTQRQWGQGNDNRSKQDSSWSSRQTSDSRGSLSHGTTDRWSGGTGIGLQQDTHQTQFATQLPGSIITTGVPGNMLLTSVQTPAGMVLTNPALATRGQAEPRFDAYKNMQTQFRRY